MKVTVTQTQQNAAFLQSYPKASGYPHLYVLDVDGTLLHSQNTAELEHGEGYSEAAFLAFLRSWAERK